MYKNNKYINTITWVLLAAIAFVPLLVNGILTIHLSPPRLLPLGFWLLWYLLHYFGIYLAERLMA